MSFQDTRERELLTAIQNLSEYDLTLRIIQPLFLAIGYDRVEYYGGPDEEGKDVVCWRTDELGEEELAVIQVKKYKPSRRAAAKNSFSEIVNQLATAAEKELPNLNGVAYLPHNIYLITPFPIDTKVFKSRFEGFRSLRNARVIDGPRLAKLICEKTPTIAHQLCGPSFNIAATILPQVINNDPLMRALDARTGRDPRSFYVDLDLSMGKVSNRLVLVSEYEPRSVTFSLGPDEWEELRRIGQVIERELGVEVFEDSIGKIEESFHETVRKNSIQREKLQFVDAELLKISDELVAAEEDQRQEEAKLRAKDPRISGLESSHAKLRNKLDLLMNSRPPHDSEIYVNKNARTQELGQHIVRRPITEHEKELDRAIKENANEIAARLSGLEKLNSHVAKLRDRKLSISNKRAMISSKILAPKYGGVINGENVANGLKESRRQILRQVEQFNTTVPAATLLRDFFTRSEGVFRVGAQIWQNSSIRESLGARFDEDLPAGVRLAVPLDRILDTGLNIILLGDAGAGKTTSLQIYGSKRLERARTGEIALFAPLARVIDYWTRAEGKLSTKASRRLETGLVSYLTNLGLHMELSDFKALLERGGSVLLLDAVDEVIKVAPWIVSAIGALASRYPKTQIITSSRTSARGIDDLNFTTLTLMPFTNSQRESFVKSWFKEDPIASKDVLRHLAEQKELNEIVRNPLLATILCVLREHKVALPANELRLYEERMRLLVGDYDFHKGVQRITAQRYFLKLASQKLAFRLHCVVRREATREELYEWAAKALQEEVSTSECELLVDELVDPCNVLCSMTDDGLFGFGHLRYQEFLAAVELLENRAIDLVDIARQPWWRGVLVLFSQMNRSIDWFIRLLVDEKMLGGLKELVLAMIEVRPKAERAQLKKFLEENLYVENNIFKIEQAMRGTPDESGFWDDEARYLDAGHLDDGLWDEEAEDSW